MERSPLETSHRGYFRPSSETSLGYAFRVTALRYTSGTEKSITASKLNDAARIERTLLAVTIVTVWCHELGEEVLETEQCCQFDPGWKRELSVFQLGPAGSPTVLPFFHNAFQLFPRLYAPFTYFPACQNAKVSGCQPETAIIPHSPPRSAPKPLPYQNVLSLREHDRAAFAEGVLR